MRTSTWTALAALTALLLGCGDGEPGAADFGQGEGRDPMAGDAPALTGDCGALPDAQTLRRLAKAAPDSLEVGGLFHGRHEWAAVVDRAGRLCVVVTAADSIGELWPGSRTIAMAKAYTANGLSTNQQPLSTARLYTMGQPGRSLYGAFVANPFDPECLGAGEATGRVCGGTIVFGGGLPLYDDEGRVVGGLGLSGDTPCADHEVAKLVRAMAGLVPPGGNFVDDITYAVVDGPSLYTHPLCDNTWRNGAKIGEAPPAPAYPQDLPPSRIPGTPPGERDTVPADTLP